MNILIKKIKYLLKRRKYNPKHLNIGVGTIMNPYGPNIKHLVSGEERIYVQIGERCIINAEFIFESTKGLIKIGNNVQIGSAKLISRESISIGDDVTMAWDITIYDHNSHAIDWEDRSLDNETGYNDLVEKGNMILNKDWSKVKSAAINICDKVWVGYGVSILKGVTIGEGAVVGACSVVTKDVPAWTVVAGNPAKEIRRLK